MLRLHKRLRLHERDWPATTTGLALSAARVYYLLPRPSLANLTGIKQATIFGIRIGVGRALSVVSVIRKQPRRSGKAPNHRTCSLQAGTSSCAENIDR